jgi:hypothetical protein
MQSNPIISQLQDILAEEWRKSNLQFTVIKTATQGYNNNEYSVSCNQKFHIHRNYSTPQPA